MTQSVRTPRGRRGTTATVTALIAVLVLAAGAIEAILLARHRTTRVLDVHDVARFGRDTQLGDTVVSVVAIAAAVLGLLLVLVAVVPSRRRLVELTEADPTVAAGLTRASFRRTLAAAAMGVDGVAAARVRGRRRITVRATTSLRHTATLPDRIETAVTRQIRELDPAPAPRVRIVLNRKDD